MSDYISCARIAAILLLMMAAAELMLLSVEADPFGPGGIGGLDSPFGPGGIGGHGGIGKEIGHGKKGGLGKKFGKFGGLFVDAEELREVEIPLATSAPVASDATMTMPQPTVSNAVASNELPSIDSGSNAATTSTPPALLIIDEMLIVPGNAQDAHATTPYADSLPHSADDTSDSPHQRIAMHQLSVNNATAGNVTGASVYEQVIGVLVDLTSSFGDSGADSSTTTTTTDASAGPGGAPLGVGMSGPMSQPGASSSTSSSSSYLTRISSQIATALAKGLNNTLAKSNTTVNSNSTT